MPSPKKLHANKTNAQASTGPKTAREKAAASANATLECALVERIAVANWRQRRLVRAERQAIQKQNDDAAAEGTAYPVGLRNSEKRTQMIEQ